MKTKTPSAPLNEMKAAQAFESWKQSKGRLRHSVFEHELFRHAYEAGFKDGVRANFAVGHTARLSVR